MENRNYSNYAFISYSHSDKTIAKALQRKLEAYRLPTAICKKHGGLPRTMKPIFRDETDLAGNRVQGSLDKELNDSRYLIVICSPKSARSSYVNDELPPLWPRGGRITSSPTSLRVLPFPVEKPSVFRPLCGTFGRKFWATIGKNWEKERLF